jgi:hypothetical protein
MMIGMDGEIYHRYGCESVYSAIEMFQVIRDITVLNKLSGGKEFANGKELADRVNGNGGGFAYYRLHPYRDILGQLEKNDLIHKTMRNSPPYGYGCDEQYSISAQGYRIISEGKTNDGIAELIHELWKPAQIDMWWR